jgi:hypothetical protein
LCCTVFLYNVFGHLLQVAPRSPESSFLRGATAKQKKQ